MKKQEPPINLPEFMAVWLKCVNAINVLVMEKGYDALTAENICKRSGLPENAIDTYFGSLDALLKMHDGVILMEQAFKVRHGNEKPE